MSGWQQRVFFRFGCDDATHSLEGHALGKIDGFLHQRPPLKWEWRHCSIRLPISGKRARSLWSWWMGLWYGLFANKGLMFAWWTSLEFSGGTSICCRWNYKKFVVRYKAFCPVFWQDEIQRLCLTIGHIVLQSRTNSPAGRALQRPSQNFGRRLRGWIHQRKEKNRNWLPIFGLRGWGDAHCLSLQKYRLFTGLVNSLVQYRSEGTSVSPWFIHQLFFAFSRLGDFYSCCLLDD